jgi:hypothetical protein
MTFTAQLKQKSQSEKADYILNSIQSIGEETDQWVTLGCKKCRTSFYSGNRMMVLTRTDTIKWSLIWKTPKTIRNQEDLALLIGKDVKYMHPYSFQSLCSWTFPYVQTCMILLCHAFHCPGVQCYFIQDRMTWSKEDREKQVELDRKDQTLMTENENDTIEPIIWGGGGYNTR